MNRLDAYRLIACKLILHACNGANGRDESDPVYQSVVEGRDSGKMQRSYSSCGDLAHWLLYRLGVRESWVNREESYRRWRSGRNISDLCWPPCPSRPRKEAERYQCGDILIVYNQPDTRDAHALVVLEHNGDVVLSGDYGQPGGQLRNRTLVAGLLGGRAIRHVLPLGSALTGTLAPPDWTLIETLATGEELDAWAAAIGFPLPPPSPEAA